MSSTQEAVTRESPIRRDSVIMGRADFFSVVLRLIGVELYKIRRRTMSKVLSTIGIIVMVSTFVVTAMILLFIVNAPVNSFLLPRCTGNTGIIAQPCIGHDPTSADMARAAQYKHERVIDASAPLRLPDSMNTANQIIQSVGLVLIVILAGTIVGGEYSGGTVRLMFTRGPTRTQFVLSKVGAILLCTALGVIAGMVIGAICGAILNLFSRVPQDLAFFNVLWPVHALLFCLEAILALFMYAMLAMCLSSLGRATAAGVAGTLVWWVLERVLGGAFYLAGTQIKGPVGDVLTAIPDYFIGNNVNALLTNQAKDVYGGLPAQLSDIHAILVLAGYLVLFIGLSWWVTERRDITN